jgi:hypothetical protein
MKAGEHGPDKLYDKFLVAKTKDTIYIKEAGVWSVPNSKALSRHIPEFYFVMRPETNDLAAQGALEVYARLCHSTYPDLSLQIRSQLQRIAYQYPDGNPALRGSPNV